MDSALTTNNMSKQTNVLIVGANGVGKTSFMHYLIHNKPILEPRMTVGVEFATMYHNDKSYHLWEVEGLQTISLLHNRTFDHVFVVCDAMDMDTRHAFDRASRHPHATFTHVANKCDLLAARDTSDIIYASSRTGEGIDTCRDIILANSDNMTARSEQSRKTSCMFCHQ